MKLKDYSLRHGEIPVASGPTLLHSAPCLHTTAFLVGQRPRSRCRGLSRPNKLGACVNGAKNTEARVNVYDDLELLAVLTEGAKVDASKTS